MEIIIPADADCIIDTLESGGYEAYVVGGCVRDALLHKTPDDWDICTSALPEQTMKIFEGRHIIETGLKHGTVTLMMKRQPFEITTYRVDGKYRDNRRPEQVKFVNVLKRDLARRDFTINAMAYNPKTGLADYYGGQQDLAAKIIKCVGNPDKRFKEDALRIMRAMRFAAVFGFTIETATSRSMYDNKTLLHNISKERIAAELNKMIVGDGVKDIVSEHIGVFAEIIPEFLPAAGFKQNNPHHCYDVLEHILHSVAAAPKDVVIRLAMLFHDIGKPLCYTEPGDGKGHFHGHQQISSDMSREILSRLKYDNATIGAVKDLVLYHDANITPEYKYVKRWLNKIGEDTFGKLLEVKRADAMAQSEKSRQDKLNALDEISAMTDEIIEQRQCFSLKDLKINGADLIGININEGKTIGEILKQLLNLVIDGQIENKKILLLETAKKLEEQIKKDLT